MREIKFRVWDIVLKEMSAVCKIDFCGIGDFGSSSVSVLMKNGNIIRTSRYEDIVLQQYTGLKDKNGFEIYESDLVSGWYSRPDNKAKDGTKIEEITGEVFWDRGAFYVKVVGGIASPYSVMLLSRCLVEVKGNIWEDQKAAKTNNIGE